ncbi:hypothetical protein KAT63_04530 [Candidatus Parcubacteria bacterium]|jgi:hypothetical protein|nr:hypothetical protein [Candidatus Parcubacteria bacterium]
MLGQLIKKNNVDISKIPQRYFLYLGLDNLKKKIVNKKGGATEYLNMISSIDSLLNRIQFGENKDILDETRELLGEIMQFEIFSKNTEEIENALNKIETT